MYQYYPEKKHHYYIYPLVVLISFILGWQATSYGLLGKNSEPAGEETAQTDDFNNSEIKKLSDDVDLDLFWTVWGEVVENYVDETAIDPEKMVYGAIKGLVSSLDDPYTVYMDPV